MTNPPSTTKMNIMLLLAGDQQIFDLINNPDISYEYYDELIGENIFPYLKVDHTVQQSGTFIGIKIDFPNRNKNIIYKNTSITFLIISSNNQVLTPQGFCRTDLIAERINSLFDWSSILGYRMELSYEKENPLNEDFYYREMKFVSVSPNGIVNGVKVNE